MSDALHSPAAGDWGSGLPIPYASFVEVLRTHAHRQPDARAYTFLVDGDDETAEITYAQLDAQARAIAAALQAQFKPGDRAMLLYAPGLEYVAAYLGCLYAGVIAVPAYPPDPMRLKQTLPRLEAIAGDCGPAAVLSTEMITGFGQMVLAELPHFQGLPWIATDTVDPAQADAWRDPQAQRDTLAFLQYTSGSTATPRGVMVSHWNLLHNVGAGYLMGHAPYERNCYVSWLPCYHDMGLIGGILQPLYGGFHGVLMSPLAFLQRPLRWLKAISKYRGTTSPFPNFALDLCTAKIKREERDALDLSSWRLACNGAEPIRKSSVDRFAEYFAPAGFRASVHVPCYGLAEATLMVTGLLEESDEIAWDRYDKQGLLEHRAEPVPHEDPDGVDLVSCGEPLSDLTLAIADAESCEALPDGVVGEVWIAGPSVAQGYWNKPEDSERVFRARLADGRGPWLRTGDLGFLRDGALYVTGRIKDMIIIAGQNHYPQDIERTLEASHPALRTGCSAAFAVSDDSEERLVVVAELNQKAMAASDDPKALAEAVKQAVRSSISGMHALRVHDIVLLPTGAIHKTSSGKIQRHACRRSYLEHAFEAAGAGA